MANTKDFVFDEEKKLQTLPSRLRQELQKLAYKYRDKGVHLFIFGSFARAENRSTSDLDIGVEWDGEHLERLFNQLYQEIRELPTIRKIDLVDFKKAGENFKEMASKDKIYL